jgi:ribonuclease P protein component
MGGRCSAAGAPKGDIVSRFERGRLASGARRASGQGARVRELPLVGRLKARAVRQPALMLAIGRRSGGASVRSRVKRVIRETFRRCAGLHLPQELCVEIGAEGDLSQTPRRVIRAATEALLRRLIEQWKASRPSRRPPVEAPSH